MQHDLDDLGIAKTAREEKKRARDEKLKQQENERMAKLYREHVLKEKPAPADLVQMIMPAPKPEPPRTKKKRWDRSGINKTTNQRRKAARAVGAAFFRWQVVYR